MDHPGGIACPFPLWDHLFDFWCLGDGSFTSFPVHTKRIIWIRFRTKRIRVDGVLTLGAVGGSWKRCLRSSHSPSLSKTKLKRPIVGYVWPHSPILIVSFFIAGDSSRRIKRAFVASKVKHFCWVGLGYIKVDTLMKLLIWATSIQGSQNLVPEMNVHITFEFVSSIEGTPLFRGKRQFFWATKPGFNFQ